MSGSTQVWTGHRHFPNVLLVCGPSGAGKSTFITSMVEGRLAPELMSLIPANAVRWPTVLENDLRKHRAVPDAIASQIDAHGGVIFHYDTFFIHRIGSQDYSKDPISPYLFETTNLTVVNIKPTPRQLKAQYDQRLHAQFTKMGYVRGLWRQSGRKWLKKLRYRFFGIGLPYTRDLYNQTASIETCHRSWEKFLGNLIGARQVTQLVEIIPEGGPDSDRFKLLNSHEESNGNPRDAARREVGVSNESGRRLLSKQ